MTDREQVEALPFTKPLDTDEFHQGVNYAMELVCVFLGADPHSFSWDAATEEFEGDVLSVLGNMFEASFGEDTNPDTLRALLRERDTAEALAYERAADVVACQCHCRPVSLDKQIRALTPSPNALEEYAAAVRAEERERCARIAEDEDMAITQWVEDRNTKVAQETARQIAAAIREKAK